MNYRHAYHAGNFADVFKHVLLARMLVYLMRKDAPLRFIDTHAGPGWYDLSGEEAGRTGEWRDGIGRLVGASPPGPLVELLQPYLAVVTGAAVRDRPGRYPGSPGIAARLLRPADRMIFCELHPVDCGHLRRNFSRDDRVKAIEIDGYMGLHAYVPPIERRGLVLVDPPFEDRGEFGRLANALAVAWRKWPTGTYALWYPLKAMADADHLHGALREAGVRKILRLELAVDAIAADSPLAATGMAVINPPYVLEEEARSLLPFLMQTLARGPGAEWRVAWTVGEDG